MSGQHGQWTRRQVVAFTSAALTSFAFGRQLPIRPARPFAYVASNGREESEGAIYVFDTSWPRWRLVQTVAAVAPAHLETHPNLAMLYAVHEIGSWEHRPRGAVSAFAICSASGTLKLRNCQPLSLSATHPAHAAVAPDGSHLIIAARSGGIYNLFPLAADGALLPPSAVRKEIGSHDGEAFRSSTPARTLCHPDGRTVFAVDEGLQALSAFTVASESIELSGRSPVVGRYEVVLSPCGGWVYALSTDDGRLAVYRYDASAKRTIRETSSMGASLGGPALMAMHPGGGFLVVAVPDRLVVLSVDTVSGLPSLLRGIPWGGRLQTLFFSPHDASLVAVEHGTHRILSVPLDPLSGRLGVPRPVAQVAFASCVAFANV